MSFKSVADMESETGEVLELVDTDAIPYLQCLKGAGNHGFAPVGWLYTNVMEGLCEKGFARRSGGAFVLSARGADELEKHERNEAKRFAKAPSGSLDGFRARFRPPSSG